jgi:hypothetical protein
MAEWTLVALTGATLLVFFRYAYDTYRIARASVSQTENSLTPFLAVAMRERTAERPGGWAIQNQGFGPALNISYSRYDGDGIEGRRRIAPLAKEAQFHAAHDDIANAFAHDWQFNIQYESLSGKRYQTTARIDPEAGLETRFHGL